MKITYIAEIGSNWRISNDLDECWNELVNLISNIEADLVKFQAWDTPSFINRKHPDYNTFKKFQLPKEWYPRLINLLGPRFMATPFDKATADLLHSLGQKTWKISSGDLVNTELITHIAKMNQPIYLSTGNGNEYEIKRAVQLIRNHTFAPLTLMHCISRYPTSINELGLPRLDYLHSFGVPVGWSSHVPPCTASVAASVAVSLGATVIEYHVMGSSANSPDAVVSLTTDEAKSLHRIVNSIHTSLNTDPIIDEHELCWARRGQDGLRPWIELA